MSQASIVPHVIGWDLSAPEDADYRHPTFVMTLPFDQNLVKKYITDGVLNRTKRRWAWFGEAQRRNPALGTLQYLPAEIRRMIWKDVFCCRDTLSSDGLWEYDCTCGPIFSTSAYFFGFGRRGLGNGVEGLRQVSTAVKADFDDAFFFLRTFRFNQAANLNGFICQLTPELSDRISSFEIGICTLYNMEVWMDPMTRLPSGLREVRFRIYHVLFNWYGTERGWESLVYLGKLVERAAQSSPDAQISISSTNQEPLSPECQIAADEILERLQRQKEYHKRVTSNSSRSRLSVETDVLAQSV